MTKGDPERGRGHARGSVQWALHPAQIPSHSLMLASLGRRLRSEYKPIFQDPIPENLNGLVHRLVTSDQRGSGDHKS